MATLMTDREITGERIDVLLRFLPLLLQEGRHFSKIPPQEYTDDGTLIMVHPIYDDDVARFFHEASASWWSDYHYLAHPAHKKLNDFEFIGRASMDEIRTLLTTCVRGERFCDGFWENVLHSGTVLRILERLQELRLDLE